MKTYKCNSCGAELEFEAGSNISVCEYCGTKTALDDKVFIGWNPELTKAADSASGVEFAMYADKVFALTGRGIAVTGGIASGSVRVNDTVKVIHDDGSSLSFTVAEIEKFRQKPQSAQKGETVSLILAGASKGQINVGDIVIKGNLDLKQVSDHIKSYYVPLNDRAGAINYYRTATGLDLKAAKSKVDKLF